MANKYRNFGGSISGLPRLISDVKEGEREHMRMVSGSVSKSAIVATIDASYADDARRFGVRTTFEDDKSGIYASFVMAMEAKQVVDVDQGARQPVDRLLRKTNWTIESYHFGDLLDPANSDGLFWATDVVSEPELPWAPAAYTFSIGGIPYVLAKRTIPAPLHEKGEIACIHFFRLAPDGIWERVEYSMPALTGLIFLADQLLTDRTTVELEPTQRVRLGRPSISRNRSIPGSTVIHLQRRLYPNRPVAHGGSSKRPHERRSHTRRLRSGRIIRVTSSSIRGGTGRPKAYDVIR